VGPRTIQRRLDVSPSAFRKWRKHGGAHGVLFPAPLIVNDDGEIWDWPTVQAWHAAHSDARTDTRRPHRP
jgi:hypothetical protein